MVYSNKKCVYVVGKYRDNKVKDNEKNYFIDS